MTDFRRWPRADRWGASGAAAAVLVLAVLDVTTSLLVISSIGLVVVVASLFIHRRAVVPLSLWSLACGLAVVLLADVPQAELRFANVVVGCAVGVAAATARDLRTRELRRLQRRDEQLLASLEEGVYGLDSEGRVTFVNPAVERLLGFPERELVGRRMHDVAHHSHVDGRGHDEADCPVLAALDGEPVGPLLDEVFWSAAGAPVRVDVSARPLLEGGRCTGVVVSLRDARPRLQAQQREVERAEQQRVVQALSRALLPELPRVPGLGLDVAYLPVEPGSPSGGDLYDVLPLADGSVHVLVVDVTGKGVESTRDALRVVSTARALVLQGTPPRELVAGVDRILSSTQSPVTATAVVGRYHPCGRWVVASGGHPPPLLLRSDGSTRWLEASGRPVGYPLAGSDDEVEVALEPGDAVLLYSDGLVEAGRDILRGLEAVERTAASMHREERGRPLPGWARRLADEVLACADRRDDTVALVLRREAG